MDILKRLAYSANAACLTKIPYVTISFGPPTLHRLISLLVTDAQQKTLCHTIRNECLVSVGKLHTSL